MIENTIITPAVAVASQPVRLNRSLCWGAIFAGVVTAMGIHLLLLALGTGIGLATFSATPDDGSIDSVTARSAIAWSLCALAALFTGGWMAGCFSASPKTGCLHGIAVWSTTMVISFILVSTGGGMALGGAVKIVGGIFGAAGAAAGAGARDLAKQGLEKAAGHVSAFVDEAVQSGATNAAPAATIRAKREIGVAVSRLFLSGADIKSGDNQAAVTKALRDAGMDEAAAKRMLEQWTASYENFKAGMEQAKNVAEAKAKEAATKAAKKLALASTVAFFAFLTGLIVTVLGAICGAKKTYLHTSSGILVE